MRLKNRIGLIAAVLLMLAMIPAQAAGLGDGKTGSISVRIHTGDGVDVPGAHIELYAVGEPVMVNSNLTFEPNAAFAGSGIALNDLNAANLATELAAYAESSGVTAMSQDSGADGYVKFDGLEAGLYLVTQDGFAEGTDIFSEIEPFLVSLPMTNEAGTGWTYKIDAQPKVIAAPKPTATPAPTAAPDDENLPQTGMLMWPVVAMGGAGIVLFSIGFMLWISRKKDA